MTTDAQLLRDYAAGKSQDAFTELVRRHVDLVYSAALRQVHSPQLAEEVSQSAFADLARAADHLPPDTILAAWLYQVARRTAIDVVRRESRRQARERLAVEMAAMNTDADWNHIEPLLEDAMETLDDADRAAILLRYFENKSLREVGQSLGTSDDAAQKRVSRAVERLREFFAKRGLAIGASGLVVLISANAVHAAPLSLVPTISTAVLAGTAIHTSTALTATKAIAMTTLQKTLVTATIVILAGTSLYEARKTSDLAGQIQTLQKQQAPLIAQNQQLQHERDDASSQLTALLAENSQLKSGSNTPELLRLRAEVGQLREVNGQLSSRTNDSRETLVKSWLERRDKLKQTAEQHPEKSIPEFQLLSEEQWLGAAMSARFDNETNILENLTNLRRIAENNIAGTLHDAVSKYVKANGGHFPTSLSQLQSYFEKPLDEAVLDRWEILPQSALPNQSMGGDWVITDKSPVDRATDVRWAIGPVGYGNTSYPSVDQSDAMATLNPALKAYAAANNGKEPTEPSQILPYLTTPEQRAAYQKLLQTRVAP